MTTSSQAWSSKYRNVPAMISIILSVVSCSPKVPPLTDPGRPAQPVAVSISGAVRYRGGSLKGARVAIGDTILRLVTDDQGRFRAAVTLPNDCYELRAHHMGFVPIVTTLRVEGPGQYTVGTLWIREDSGMLQVDTMPGSCPFAFATGRDYD